MAQGPRLDEFLEAITHAARFRPETLAIVDERRRVTYRELVDEFEAGAQRLVDAGLTPGDRVALVAENSADYLVTVLAIWRANGAPVTIYPSTSATELRDTLIDADPVLVLGDDVTEALIRTAAHDIVPTNRLDAVAPNLRVSEASPTPPHLASRLALICYSSGTTSRPKAIMLSSEAILNTARTFGESWQMNQEDVTLVCLPMAWLFGLTTASLSTIFAGGTVVSRRRARPELVLDAIQKFRVTVLPAVTTVLTKLAKYLEDERTERDFSSLRFIVSGGEPRNEQSFARLRGFTGLPVHDNYCASEMQPLVTYDPHSDPEPRAGSAGKLVERSELRILDGQGQQVVVGEVGEGFSRGPGLMLGYWNDDESTKDALTEDGWYRTKDLLRMDEEGYVYVVGRTSDMIIRGGSNVSPEEVEACLRQHPSVADIAVVGASDALYGEEVVAVIQTLSDSTLEVEDLRAYAHAELPAYKAPARYLQVEQLPVNATTGKVSRKNVKKMLEEGALS